MGLGIAVLGAPLLGGGYSDKVRSIFGTSLIAYWPLWETSGSVAYDISGNARNGAYSGITFPGVEMLTNGGFETDGAGGADVFAGWTETAGDGAIAKTTTAGEFNGGAAAAKLTTGASVNTLVKQNIVAIPGNVYRLTFYTRGDGTHGGGYNVYDTTNSAFIVTNTATGVTGTSYQAVTVTFTAPAACVTVTINLKCGAVAADVVYYDDVAVVCLTSNGIGDGHQAAQFNGSSSLCNVYSTSLRDAFNGNEGTLMIWLAALNTGVWSDGVTRYLCNFQVDGNNYIAISKNTAATISLARRAAGGSTNVQNFTGSTPAWTHLALTWSATANKFRAFANGVQIGTDAAIIGSFTGAIAATTSCIFCGTSVPQFVWNGYGAHVALWSAPLSIAQIAQLARVSG